MQQFEWLVHFFFGIGMFLNGTLFIPQAYRIWREKSAKDLSAIMFTGFLLIQLFTVLHGYFEKDWALMIGMGYSMFTCSITTILIFLYRRGN